MHKTNLMKNSRKKNGGGGEWKSNIFQDDDYKSSFRMFEKIEHLNILYDSTNRVNLKKNV